MTNYDLWLKACRENKTLVYELEPGLYKTQNEYLSHNNYYRTTPVYHVWGGDKRIYCGMSMRTAYKTVRK